MIKESWQQENNETFPMTYFLMPNGQVIVLECHKNLTLSEIKNAVFNEAKNYPIYNLLKEPKFYNFSYVTTHGTIQVINQNEEKSRKLVNLRNIFKPVFKFVEADLDDVEKYVQSQISSLIGVSYLNSNYNYNSNSNSNKTENIILENQLFLSKYKEFVQKLAFNRDNKPWEQRFPIAYPPDIDVDFGPTIPSWLKAL